MNLTINPEQSTLLVIDLQQRLLPAIDDSTTLLDNASRLLQSANTLGVTSLLTEQIPERLGATVDDVMKHYHGPVYQKTAFSAAEDKQLIAALESHNEVIIFGTETHVCVLQTALHLLELEHRVWVVADACGSRSNANKQAGLQRMQQAGATLVSTEMVIFEWLKDATHEKFREVLALIK